MTYLARTFREAFWALKTKRYAPDFTLFEYWIWRMYRALTDKHPNYRR